MGRCLLIQSGLSLSFWAEAISTSNYLRNRCPTRALNDMTSYQAWHGRKPNITHLREFGCKVFCLDTNYQKGKFESRSREGILVGYAEQSKGYRIWIPSEKKIEISRDIKCLEQNVRRPEENIGNFELEETITRRTDESSQREERISEVIIEDGEMATRNDNEEASVNDRESNEMRYETPKRGRGRPRNLRTGHRGRPKKVYQPAVDRVTERNNSAQIEHEPSDYESAAEEAEIACTVEIPMKHALSGTDKDEWLSAMADEVRSIIKNNTWDVVDKSESKSSIGGRFVLRNKYNPDGSIQRRKARIVAQGFCQQPGIDFNESFAPVARLSSIRLMTALAAQYKMKIRQFDISTAYLNGALEEDVFMRIPKHFDEALEEIIRTESDVLLRRAAMKMLEDVRAGNKVFYLKKALYGLRQAGYR